MRFYDEFSRLTFWGELFEKKKEEKSGDKMQDSREEGGGGGGGEKELVAAIRQRMRESGALDRISAGVRSGTGQSLKFKI